MRKVNNDDSEDKEDKHNLFPLREVLTAPGFIRFVNVPINTGDIRAFKKEMGRLLSIWDSRKARLIPRN